MILVENGGWVFFIIMLCGCNYVYMMYSMVFNNVEWLVEILIVDDIGVISVIDV